MSEVSRSDEQEFDATATAEGRRGLRSWWARFVPDAEREPLWRVFAPLLVIGLLSGPRIQFLPMQIATFFPELGWVQAAANYAAASFLTGDGTSWLIPAASLVLFFFLPWFVGLWLCLGSRFSPPAMALYAFGIVCLDALIWLVPNAVRLRFDQLLLVNVPNAVAPVLGVVLGAVMGFGITRFVDATLRPLGATLVQWLRGSDEPENDPNDGESADRPTAEPVGPDWSFLGFTPASAALRRFVLGFLALVAAADAVRLLETFAGEFAHRLSGAEHGASPLGFSVNAAFTLILPVVLAYVAYRIVRASGPRSIWIPSALGLPTGVVLLVMLPFNMRTLESLSSDLGRTHFGAFDRMDIIANNVGPILVAVAPFIGVWLALRAGTSGPWTPDGPTGDDLTGARQ